MNEERAREGIKHVTQALTASKTGALLDELAWSREVEERFFASDATELPTPTYAVDHEGLGNALRATNEMNGKQVMQHLVASSAQKWARV